MAEPRETSPQATLGEQYVLGVLSAQGKSEFTLFLALWLVMTPYALKASFLLY